MDITEQKRIEEALRASEERCRVLVENANEAIVVAQDGLLKFFNRKALEIMGFSEEELSTKPFMDIVYPEDRAMVALRHSDRLTGREVPPVYPFRILDKKGQVRWVQINAVRIEWEGAPATLNFLTEITEQKHAEEALKESMEKYKILVENSGDILFTLGPDLRITYVNPIVERFTGYTAEESVKQSIAEILTPSSVGVVRDALRRILEAEKSGVRISHERRWELEHFHKDGSTVWGEVTLRPMKDPEGRFAGMIGVTRDITSRKGTEGKLRESERRLELALEGAREGLWDWNILTEKIYFNPQWLETFGYEEQEVISTIASWVGISHPDDLPLVRRALIDHFKGRTTFYEMEHRIRDKVGEWRWIRTRGTVVEKDPRGVAVRMLGTCLDITDYRRAEEKKIRLEAQLRQARKMESLGTLAGGIAHDFNNILAAIVGYAELALMDISRGLPNEERLEQILKSGLRAKKLVQQILSFGRRTDHETKPIQIGAVIKETMKLLRATLPSTIEIIQEVEDRSYTVLADSTQIHQVLMNLCTNAAHAMRERVGVLKVSLKPVCVDENSPAGHAELSPGAYTRLTVSDTGEGMDIETLGRVFEPFFTTKEIGQGTGMGLAMVHGIVKAHGGAITLHSEPGQGSAFHVYLPLLETEEEKAAPGDAEPLPTGTEHILFVDDEETLADIGQQMLERFGYRVTRRTSSLEALEVFKAEPDKFHLVISDQTMPKMTGLDLAKKILSIRPDIPIIICTGYSSQISAQKAEAMGVKRVLLKPLVVRETASAIREVLDKK